eukprot:13697938-Ditylum_brightwellii.AAC.1
MAVRIGGGGGGNGGDVVPFTCLVDNDVVVVVVCGLDDTLEVDGCDNVGCELDTSDSVVVVAVVPFKRAINFAMDDNRLCISC